MTTQRTPSTRTPSSTTRTPSSTRTRRPLDPAGIVGGGVSGAEGGRGASTSRSATRASRPGRDRHPAGTTTLKARSLPALAAYLRSLTLHIDDVLLRVSLTLSQLTSDAGAWLVGASAGPLRTALGILLGAPRGVWAAGRRVVSGRARGRRRAVPVHVVIVAARERKALERELRQALCKLERCNGPLGPDVQLSVVAHHSLDVPPPAASRCVPLRRVEGGPAAVLVELALTVGGARLTPTEVVSQLAARYIALTAAPPPEHPEGALPGSALVGPEAGPGDIHRDPTADTPGTAIPAGDAKDGGHTAPPGPATGSVRPASHGSPDDPFGLLPLLAPSDAAPAAPAAPIIRPSGDPPLRAPAAPRPRRNTQGRWVKDTP